MTDEQEPREPVPLAAEVADALDRRRRLEDEALAGERGRRTLEAKGSLLLSAGAGGFLILVGLIVLAAGAKSWAQEMLDGLLTNDPIVAMTIGVAVTLVGLLLLVRAVVGWAVGTGMDASGR